LKKFDDVPLVPHEVNESCHLWNECENDEQRTDDPIKAQWHLRGVVSKI